MSRAWLLPDGVEEWVEPDSWSVELLRRRLLDAFRDDGYQLIYPPLIEHLDTLLTGAGSDLESQTFKLVDPSSGRLVGLRADMTPQAARIAARRYADQASVRLCYLGTVLRTDPDSVGGPRAIRQAGCEIFGEPGSKADLEAIAMALQTLELADVRGVYLDLGHVGVYRSIVARAGIGADDEARLFDILQRKSRPDLEAILAQRDFGTDVGAWLAAVLDLSGGADRLAEARQRLAGAGADALAAIDELETVVLALAESHPDVELHIDLAELRGYRYQTGIVFAAYSDGHGRELARGGRYDGIGEAYGRAMPATGFSADINELLRLADSPGNAG